MAKVIFSFEGREIDIQCLNEDKMKYICNKFSSKIKLNLDSLYFIYNGNKINLDLNFKEQANSIDKKRNQMNILVFRKENDVLKCKKCGEVISLPILNNILKNINNQKDMLIEMKNQIENIINLYDINDIIRKIKLLKIVVDNLISENEKNIQNIKDNINNKINNNINLLNQKQNYNSCELTIVNAFNQSEQNIIINFIVKSFSKYSDYINIAHCIFNDCFNWKKGLWTINVGEKNKFNSMQNSQKSLAYNYGTYKISINYTSNI